MDAFLCGVQGALTKTSAMRFRPLPVRVGMAGSRGITKQAGEKGGVVAKIIEFYVPSNFQKKEKWVPARNRGKIIEFSVQTVKSA